MIYMGTEKKAKTFIFPIWLLDMLREEVTRVGGHPGLIASASIAMFLDSSEVERAKYINLVQREELKSIYNVSDNEILEMAFMKKKHTPTKKKKKRT